MTDIVEEHKKILMLSGNLSDFQFNNLKKWPFIVIGDGLKEVEIKYDFFQYVKDKNSGEKVKKIYAGKITYDFKIDGDLGFKKEELQTRLGQLIFWVKTLFWKETSVVIKKNGKKWII